MFKYVSDVSELSHYIIKKFVDNKNIAIDATLGNGYDTDYLAEYFSKVYAFDIQYDACQKYLEKKNENVVVICDSHHKIDKYVNETVDCIVYNLGFLPGGDKNITTKYDTTVISIDIGLKLLASGGIMLIAIYRGHNEGKIEETFIMDKVRKLDKSIYGVMSHKVENRSEKAPMLIVIEKK